MTLSTLTVGDLLRDWRQRRRLSQLALALGADVSPRHVSFLETGRAQPSRALLLRLAERLDIPLRERNTLLVAAGYAPVHRQRSLDDPELDHVLAAVRRVLTGHEPYPALAIDRHWTLIAANRALGPLLAGVAPELLDEPVNVLCLALHPRGLAPRVRNFGQWRAHLLERLRHQIELTADPTLVALCDELSHYPTPENASAPLLDRAMADVFVPLLLEDDTGELSFFSTTTVFGTPVDVTVAELAIEAFFPADDATATALHRAANHLQPPEQGTT